MGDTAGSKRVVVGVDGSDHGQHALDWAVAESDRRRTPLHIVHSWLWPLSNIPLGPPPGGPDGAGLQAEAEQIATEAVASARGQAPNLVVTSGVGVGGASAVLIGASADAELVVVGCRGLGGFGLLLGSVGVHLAAHSHCPVVVVRGEASAEGPVVVGVDGSPCSNLAAAAAFEAAQVRKAPLTVVHAEHASGVAAHLLHRSRDSRQRVEQHGHAIIDSALAGVTEKYPEVPVTRQVVAGPANRALIEASHGAQLLVVGSRGRGGLAGFRLGSASHAAIHHSTCPVLVCREVASSASPSPV